MDEKTAVQRAYDEIAETYAAQRSTDSSGIDVLDRFLHPFSENTRILDAGCGQGTPVLERISDSSTAVGVDISCEQLQIAVENTPAAALIQGDMTTLPFREGVFDAVTAYHSMIHIPIDEHQTVIDEFARVLQSDGRLLLSEGAGEWKGANPDWIGSGVEMRWSMVGPETTRKQLLSAGFSVKNRWNLNDELAEEDDVYKPLFLAHLER